jgi:hypothetical protein
MKAELVDKEAVHDHRPRRAEIPDFSRGIAAELLAEGAMLAGRVGEKPAHIGLPRSRGPSGPPPVAVDGMSTLPVMASLAIAEASIALVTRQAHAVGNDRRATSAARMPRDVLTANADYWTGLSDDPDGDGRSKNDAPGRRSNQGRGAAEP